jgi:hypothetical protein
MRPNEFVKCPDFPCQDVNKESYIIPNIEIYAENIKTLMISEAPPEDLADYFYAPKNPFYVQTTIQAFSDAGFNVSSMRHVLDLGVYITTAIKCAKTAYAISPKSIDNCSIRILEKELNLFPKTKAVLLMGGHCNTGNEFHRCEKCGQEDNSQRLHIQNKKSSIFL